MFLSRGEQFTCSSDARDKAQSLVRRWNRALAPAIIHFVEESGLPGPESEELNGNTYICPAFL